MRFFFLSQGTLDAILDKNASDLLEISPCFLNLFLRMALDCTALNNVAQIKALFAHIGMWIKAASRPLCSVDLPMDVPSLGVLPNSLDLVLLTSCFREMLLFCDFRVVEETLSFMYHRFLPRLQGHARNYLFVSHGLSSSCSAPFRRARTF